MSLYIASLNSGSNGNCYYIGNESEAVLIDAGISCREIEKRMQRLGLNMQKVKAVFVSHEHSDHIKGIAMLSKKYQLPVYITETTFLHSGIVLDKCLATPFIANKPIATGNLLTIAFPKRHDASDPCSFVVRYNGIQVGIFTDIGIPCENVIKYFKECHAAFLECNYDEKMLETGNYPYYLKRRIGSANGHLSNKQALELFQKHRPPYMTHLILSHLSKNNNCPHLVQNLFNENADGVKMIVASRFKETGVYYLYCKDSDKSKVNRKVSTLQLSFAFS